MWSSRVIGGVVLILLGIGWLLQAAGIVHFDSNIVAPLALIGIGIALVAGAPRGLHVPLFVAGIVLAAVLAGDTTASHVREVTHVHVGSTNIRRPSLPSQIRPYDLGAGTLTVDLTSLPIDGKRTYNIRAHVGTGRLNVIVPSGTSVTVDAHTGVGSLDIFGQRSGGAGTSDSLSIQYANRAEFVLRLRVGAGSIHVTHAPSTAPEVVR
jgi:hypothetical protein